ncbi:D-alanine-D-alanine ligase [Balneicella halophila]|uniref:D-alanine--D-alanine ligase n=1 Tax=Balneicella halophila TaxID=1537566 RepID=A0A7L4USI4_BALHA|nr:D-alanine--D-alanine ligase [Balneicella halophila]PVX52472.1 D-alanine-D-alanine ligase [Balneicella halophila]
MKKNIAVVAGGYSSERQVSLWTAENIMNALDKSLYNPYLVLIDKDRWYLQAGHTEHDINKNNFSVSLSDYILKFDYAFIAIHGTPAEDGLLQGYFDILGIPYSASGVMESSLSFNKFAYNHFIKSFDVVNIAKSVLVLENTAYNVDEIIETTGLPCFVKPNQQGSSFGIAKVTRKDDLSPAITKAFEQDNAVIIEEFITGTEVTNGVIKLNGEVKALPITEVVSKNDLFDFQAKYDPDFADEITPARISDELTKQIQETTEKIYKISGFKGIVRIDYIIRDNDIYMLEANTIPGMTSNSFIPKQLAYEGKEMSDILSQLIG